MDFKVLGPLSVRDGGVTITPSAPKPRQVLALLLMQANHLVSMSALIRELWDEDPPRTAHTTLQTYILQLRKMFAASPAVRPQEVSSRLLVTGAGGYMVRVEPNSLDLFRFERLAREGRAALARDEDHLAAIRLREALSVWRGQALLDVQAGPLLEMQIVRLEEARLVALESRIEADLRLGLHHDLLSELAFLAAQHPMHESLHTQLMVALYRCGRQSEALDVFHRMRGRLVRELGLEPSVRMHRMQQAILEADPVLDAPHLRTARAPHLAVPPVAIA